MVNGIISDRLTVQKKMHDDKKKIFLRERERERETRIESPFFPPKPLFFWYKCIVCTIIINNRSKCIYEQQQQSFLMTTKTTLMN